MRTVEIHRWKRTDAREFAVNYLRSQREDADKPQTVEVPTMALRFLVGDGASGLGFAVPGGLPHPDILELLRVAADATVGLFELGAHPGEDVELTIGDRVIRIRLEGSHAFTGPYDLWRGFYAASASRHDKALRALGELATTTLLERGALRANMLDACVPYAEALAGLARRAPRDEILAHLAVAAEKAVAERGRDPNRHVQEYYALRIEPYVALARDLAAADADAFNRDLVAALEAHKKFFDSDEPVTRTLVRREDPEGWVAFEALGLAALAHDRGIAIDVESDYIPRWLVRGEWR